MTMITDPEIYFRDGCGRCDKFASDACSARLWAASLVHVRRICLDLGLTETAKWGHPCYMHRGRNIVIIGAFQSNLRLTFFNAGLMQDPEGLLEKQGPNAQTPGMFRFTAPEQVSEREATIRAYLTEAIGYAEAGIKAPKIIRAVPIPDELTEALDADPALAEAFNALTPGRQKSYAFNLNGAKAPATRIKRIARFREKIFAGKGALDR